MADIKNNIKNSLGDLVSSGETPTTVSGFVAGLNKDMDKAEAGAGAEAAENEMFLKMVQALNNGADMQSLPVEDRVNALMQELGEAELIDENGYPDYSKGEEAAELINNAFKRWGVSEEDINEVKKQQQTMNYLSRASY